MLTPAGKKWLLFAALVAGLGLVALWGRDAESQVVDTGYGNANNRVRKAGDTMTGQLNGTSVNMSGAGTFGNLVCSGAAQVDGGIQTSTVNASGIIAANSNFQCSSTSGPCYIGGRYNSAPAGSGHTIIQPVWQSGDSNLVGVLTVNNQDAGTLYTTRFDGITTFYGYRTGDAVNGIVLQNGSASVPGTSIRWVPNSGSVQQWMMGMGTSSGDYITGSSAGALNILSNGSSNRPLHISTSGGTDIDFDFQTDGDLIVDGNLSGANLSGTNTGDQTVTIATFGSSPTANGATASGTAVTLQPASVSAPGAVSIVAQTLGLGDKSVVAGTSSTGLAKLGGPLNVGTTTVGNVGSGEDNLITYTLPANALIVTGRGVEYRAYGAISNDADAKTLKLYFGATAILTVTMPTSIAGHWEAHYVAYRTGSSAQKYAATVDVVNTGTAAVTRYSSQGTTTETETATIAIKATCESVDNDDCTNTIATADLR